MLVATARMLAIIARITYYEQPPDAIAGEYRLSSRILDSPAA